MDRRAFLQGAVLLAGADARGAGRAPARSDSPFRLRYAPHFGMFRHHAGEDPVDQLRFLRDEGFVALEDNGMPGRPVAEQERIGAALAELSIAMGVFVAHADFRRPTFASDDPAAIERIARDMRGAVEVAARVGARWCTVVPGARRPDLEPAYQDALVIDNLRRAADVLEPAGLTMVLEPLNSWTDHPGCFLTGIPQAYALCRAVNRPAVKILDDLYHQQVSEGNLIPNLDRAWSEIAYVQVGDNPGRNEPGTGEIHFGNVFRHLRGKGYAGIVGMEHGMSGNGKEGERALIEAYRAADSWD